MAFTRFTPKDIDALRIVLMSKYPAQTRNDYRMT
jgi:hypothetical protein